MTNGGQDKRRTNKRLPRQYTWKQDCEKERNTNKNQNRRTWKTRQEEDKQEAPRTIYVKARLWKKKTQTMSPNADDGWQGAGVPKKIPKGKNCHSQKSVWQIVQESCHMYLLPPRHLLFNYEKSESMPWITMELWKQFKFYSVCSN